MAGVYIKGMQMPTGCASCDFGYYRGDREPFCQRLMQRIIVPGTRLRGCPLIPVPDHGRLVDADQQIERAIKLNLETAEVISTMLRTAPTIIPADRYELVSHGSFDRFAMEEAQHLMEEKETTNG